MLNRNTYLLVALLGWTIFSATCAWQSWSLGKASLTWPSTRGSVTLNPGRGRGGAPIEVEVEYAVEGNQFRKRWGRYILEEEVPVYYDPNDPSRAVLEQGVDHPVFILWCVGASLGFFGTLGIGALLLFPGLESADSAYLSKAK